jgi:hypothetical protein
MTIFINHSLYVGHSSSLYRDQGGVTMYLSNGGRATLIRSTFSNLLSYFMSLCLPHREVVAGLFVR